MLKKSPAVLLTLFLSLLMLSVYMGDELLHPNAYFFGDSGDGLKNYFTAAYYIKYDHGFHFSGMNYPFGEHITFTDNQPSLSMILQYIDKHFFTISGHTIGIMNCCMMASYIICSIFILFLLRYFGIKNVYACFMAVGITFLSPQLDRITGHYGLSYAFVLPMYWYWFLRMQENKKKWLWLTLLILSEIFFGLIHLYMLVIGSMFLMFLSILLLFNRSAEAGRFKSLAINLGGILLPFLFVFFLLRLTDPFTDRIQVPYGFFFYTSSLRSVFLPPENIYFMRFWNELWKSEPSQWEGYAYVGAAGTLALILAFVMLICRVIRRKKIRAVRFLTYGMMGPSFLAGLLVLLFSMAIPFRYHLEFLLDHLSFLRQFRSIGRFAWMFFTVFTVFACIFYYKYFRVFHHKKTRLLAHAILIIPVSLWISDACGRMKTKSQQISVGKWTADFFDQDYEIALEKNGYKGSDFQAICPIPFYSSGTEKLSSIHGTSFMESIKASYELGLPIIAESMSRTSISNGLICAQIVSDTLIEKQILKYFPNQKPLLLVVINAQYTDAQQALLNRAELIADLSPLKLYKLDLNKLELDTNRIEKSIEKIIAKDGSHTTFLADTLKSSVIYRSFDEENDSPLFGAGSFYRHAGKYLIYSGSPVAPEKETEYEFSIWVKVMRNIAGMPYFIYQQYDSAGNIVEKNDFASDASFDILGEWIRISSKFKVLEPGNRIEFSVGEAEISLDEMMIRPVQSHVLIQNQNGRSLDNFPLSF